MKKERERGNSGRIVNDDVYLQRLSEWHISVSDSHRHAVSERVVKRGKTGQNNSKG